ncbi:MAG TPA: hypothetical protein VFU88_13320 [Ktedonobacterales bacterium]|nr:hypothetical protein [Ktedonobacterales bacterium]
MLHLALTYTPALVAALARLFGDWVYPAIGSCSVFCATYACQAGTCLGAGGSAAGSGAAGAGAGGSGAGDKGGGDSPRKLFPLPGGGWFGTDGRVHYGADADVKVSYDGVPIASGKVNVDVDAGAAPGSDPRGDIVDLNWKASASGQAGPLQGSYSTGGHVGVGIAPQVQNAYSAGYGGQTNSGNWARQFVNSND